MPHSEFNALCEVWNEEQRLRLRMAGVEVKDPEPMGSPQDLQRMIKRMAQEQKRGKKLNPDKVRSDGGN